MNIYLTKMLLYNIESLFFNLKSCILLDISNIEAIDNFSNDLLFESIAIGGLCLFTIFNLSYLLFYKNKQLPLSISLFCFSLFAILCTNSDVNIFYRFGISYDIIVKINYIFHVMFCFSFTWLCSITIKQYFNRKIYLITNFIFLFYVIISLILNQSEYYIIVLLLIITYFIYSIYICYKYLICIKEKLPINKIYFYMFLFVIVFSITEMLLNKTTYKISIIDISIALLISFIYSFILVRNQNFIKNNKEEVREYLNNTNKQLEEIIDERTQKLNKVVKELQESNSTKDMFFSIIAHDIKNPTHSIKMLSELILEDSQKIKNEHLIDLSKTLKNSVIGLSKLLENLLEWSRCQLGKMQFSPQFFYISEIVEQLENAVLPVCDSKSLKLKVTQEGDPEIFADNNMLQTILRNLVTNSAKYSYPENVIEIDFNNLGKQTIIKVVDYGTGMSKEKLQKLFKIDKVSSTIGTAKEIGTGLGLILCKNLVEMHNGTIEVESEEGLGSTFTITLPKSIN